MLLLLINIVVAILKALLPSLLNRKPDTCEDAQRQPELKKRLQDRVRKAGWTAMILLILVVPAGCMRTRTVYIPPGEPVRLREPLKDVKIWTKDKDGNNIPGKVDVPEGWFVLPDDAGQQSTTSDTTLFKLKNLRISPLYFSFKSSEISFQLYQFIPHIIIEPPLFHLLHAVEFRFLNESPNNITNIGLSTEFAFQRMPLFLDVMNRSSCPIPSVELTDITGIGSLLLREKTRIEQILFGIGDHDLIAVGTGKPGSTTWTFTSRHGSLAVGTLGIEGYSLPRQDMRTRLQRKWWRCDL